jgi:hypothetical protein
VLRGACRDVAQYSNNKSKSIFPVKHSTPQKLQKNQSHPDT